MELSDSLSNPAIVALLVFAGVVGCLYFYNATAAGCFRPVRNLPFSPDHWPVVGSLLSLGETHAFTYLRWAQKLRVPVFQMRLGSRPVVVVNSYDSARMLWIKEMKSNASRPSLYTFHRIVSSSQGVTVGTTPWSDTYRRKRKVIGVALNKPSVRRYMPIIDRESTACIHNLLAHVLDAPHQDVSVHSFFRTYALNTGLTLTYGIRLSELDQQLVSTIVNTERQVSNCRSSVAALQDYLPLLRLIPNMAATSKAIACRQRRDEYMDMLLDKLKHRLDSGTSIDCIAGEILRNPSARCSRAELKSVCLTMVSAGLDTVPAVLTYFIGHMSQRYGQSIQKRAYEEIVAVYGSGPDAWTKCVTDDESAAIPYISALVKEALRFSAMPISLPRETIRDIHYQGVTIPAGTLMLLNAFAVNFDPDHYYRPFDFQPARFLGVECRTLPHFTFGAGTRMCGGANLAERQVYVAIVRLISLFKIEPPADESKRMPSDPFDIFRRQNSLAIEPPPFQVRLIPRRPQKIPAGP